MKLSKANEDKLIDIMVIFVRVCILLLCVIVMFLVCDPASSSLNTITHHNETRLIYSLEISESNEMSGSFFLGCGTISSGNVTEYYYFEEKGSGIILSSAPAFNSVVIETNGVPRITRHFTYIDRLVGSDEIIPTGIDIYVPKGSSTFSYDL